MLKKRGHGFPLLSFPGYGKEVGGMLTRTASSFTISSGIRFGEGRGVDNTLFVFALP